MSADAPSTSHFSLPTNHLPLLFLPLSTLYFLPSAFSPLKRTLIPLAAACVIALLSTTEWGELYATLHIFGREPVVTQITLEGFGMPHVTMDVGVKTEELHAEKFIRILVDDAKASDASERSLSAPASWTLAEVQGVHIRDVVANDATGTQRRYAFPSAAIRALPVIFIFRTRDAIETITFHHDSLSPALLDLRSAILASGETQRTVQLVRKSRTIGL